jgi:hypothetical protein
VRWVRALMPMSRRFSADGLSLSNLRSAPCGQRYDETITSPASTKCPQ